MQEVHFEPYRIYI